MTGHATQLAPLIVAVPIIAGCVLLAVGRWLPRRLVDTIALAAAGTVTGLCGLLLVATGGGRVVTWSAGFSPQHGISVGVALVADPLGAGAALLAAGMISAALLYSWRYFEDVEAHYQVLLLLFLAGMTGFALSGDLFNMFVFFELMGVAAYALTAFEIEDKQAVQGGLNFGVVNSFGAYLGLMGLGLLYSRTGQLGLAQLGQALSGHPADVLVKLAFVLLSTGWLVKAAAVPFHFWTADAEAVAPSPVCAVFSAVMVELGIYGVARIYWTVFRHTLSLQAVSRTLLTVGVLTAVLGAVMCLTQRNLKRLLAYSTIAHVGLFLTAIATLSTDGLTGASVYVAAHAGVKGSLFLLSGVVLNRYGTVDEYHLHGQGRRWELLAWLFVIDGLALAALPPFGTGLGKSLAEDAVSSAGYPWAPALFVTVSALTGGAVLRATGRIFFGLGPPPTDADSQQEMSGDEGRETKSRLHQIPLTMLVALAALMIGSLAVGTIPGLANSVGDAATTFTGTRAYARQVLTGTAVTHPSVTDLGWTRTGIGLSLLTAALAVGIAALGLYHRRLPAPVRSLGQGIGPLVTRLHRAHSGHIGDYVAWLTVGVAALTLLIGLPARL